MISGYLHKLFSVYSQPVEYFLRLSGMPDIKLNNLLGNSVSLHYNGIIQCVGCQRKIKKSFNQGYCFPCFKQKAACDMCILKPQICHFSNNTCREPQWGEENCFIPHYVYLANSTGIKVGLTRHNQIPTRWIDQGAIQAVLMFKTASRKQAGLIEVIIAQHISDRTNWRKLFKPADLVQLDLNASSKQLYQQCYSEIQAVSEKFGNQIEYLSDQKILELNYPIITDNIKVNSLSFDKTPNISGKLLGIKGQYLIFDHGVLNIRKFTGYEISFSPSAHCVSISPKTTRVVCGGDYVGPISNANFE